MICIKIQVVTVIKGFVVRELGGKLATWEGTQHMVPGEKDPIAAMHTVGGAGVTVDVEEKLSGPPNTYSSTTIRVSITARCPQTIAHIQKMTRLLHAEGLRALEHHVPTSLELLVAHVNA